MKEQTLKDIDRAFKALDERDELLDKIRAEIEQERDKVYQNRQGHDTYYADGLDTALEIIDKYREGDKNDNKGSNYYNI